LEFQNALVDEDVGRFQGIDYFYLTKNEQN
jgi:hypothetical protein